jgi:hypothetical protein
VEHRAWKSENQKVIIVSETNENLSSPTAQKQTARSTLTYKIPHQGIRLSQGSLVIPAVKRQPFDRSGQDTF